MSPPQVSAEEFLAAIREGVADAIRDALGDCTNQTDAVLDAIRQGTKDAFDRLWPEQIASAIREGAMEAMAGQ